MHERVKHSIKCRARLVVGADLTCLVCRTVFIAHLSDPHRTKSTDGLIDAMQLDEDLVRQLDAQDTMSRNVARHMGFSRPHAVGQAKTFKGKLVGRASILT